MKICRIVSAYSPYSFGGADIYAENISREFAKRDNKEIIITISPSKGETFEQRGNISIYRFHPLNVCSMHNIGKGPLIKQGIWSALDFYSYYSYRKIRAILKKEEPDLVHFHTPADVTLSAFDAVKSPRLPLVFTLNDYLLLCRRVVLMHGFRRMCTNDNMHPLCKAYRIFTKKIAGSKPDIVIAPTNFILDLFRKNGFFNNCRAVVLPYGIKLDRPACCHGESGNKQTFNILYAGSLTRHKGVQVLIAAVRQIKNPRLRLDIAGEGNYREKLTALAKDDCRIVFHGKISNERMGNFYDEADVLVVPSIWNEVLGIVILEAFSSGVPVIGSRIGGIPEIISDKHNGYLFNPGDIRALRSILEKVIDDPQSLADLGRNALNTALRYGMPQHIDQLFSVYREAIEISKLRKN